MLLPAVVRQAVDVVSSRPRQLRSLLTATANLDVQFGGDARSGALTVIDGRSDGPRNRAIYLRPTGASPLGVGRTVRGVKLVSWNSAHPLGAGLRATDIEIPETLILEPQEGDTVIAESEAGPVVVARESANENLVVIGFDPLATDFANRLAGPLLFANAVRWFAPEVFRIAEFRAAAPGSVELDVAPATREQVRVETLSGTPPAWIQEDGRLRLFSPRPTVARVSTPYSTARLALELPEAAPEVWSAPDGILRGVPRAIGGGLTSGSALWPWLAVLAAIVLAVDWALFGRGPRETATVTAGPETFSLNLGDNSGSAEREREEVLR